VRTLVGFVTGCTLLPSNETLDRRSHGSVLAVRLGLSVPPPLTFSDRLFLCFMYSTPVQQGPGGLPTYTRHLDSDGGYADLPLTLLCAPVNIRKSRAAL
jgi:hypothetical protein